MPLHTSLTYGDFLSNFETEGSRNWNTPSIIWLSGCGHEMGSQQSRTDTIDLLPDEENDSDLSHISIGSANISPEFYTDDIQSTAKNTYRTSRDVRWIS